MDPPKPPSAAHEMQRDAAVCTEEGDFRKKVRIPRDFFAKRIKKRFTKKINTNIIY